MKKQLIFILPVLLILSFVGCSAKVVRTSPTVAKSVEKVNPVTIDFGQFWTGTVHMKQESKPKLGSNAQVVFYSEWAAGEGAGNVYPKSFTLSASGNQVKMDALWDNGGDIPAGIYNAFVDIDGMPKTGTIKNLKLEKGTSYKIYISFNAAKIDISLQTDGDEVIVYPAGSYEKYKKLGRLDNMPKELAINAVSSYTEKNPIYWLIPAGITLDILRTFSNGDKKWFTNYTAVPESFIKHLP